MNKVLTARARCGNALSAADFNTRDRRRFGTAELEEALGQLTMSLKQGRWGAGRPRRCAISSLEVPGST
jgi:hypothetical protein